MDLSSLLLAHGFGMPTTEVVLAAADARWREGAAALIARLPPASWAHVGSSSVPGLDAKPILDILGVVPSAEAVAALQAPLEALGFQWLGEYGISGRGFARLRTDLDYAHLHVFPAGHPHIQAMLRFRDRLRSDPDALDRYRSLKVHLSRTLSTDRDAYTNAKAALILELMTSEPAR